MLVLAQEGFSGKVSEIHSSIFELSDHGEMKGLYTLKHFSDAFWRSWLDLYFKNADMPGRECGVTNPCFLRRGAFIINGLSTCLKLARRINTLG